MADEAQFLPDAEPAKETAAPAEAAAPQAEAEVAAVVATPVVAEEPAAAEQPAAEAPAPEAPVSAAAERPARKVRQKAAPKAESAAPAEPAPVAVRKPRAAKAVTVSGKRRGRPAKASVVPAKPRGRTSAKPVVAKPVVAPISAAKLAPQAAAKPVAPRRAPAKRKSLQVQTPTLGTGKPKLAQLKENFMATPFDFTIFQTAFADIQGKAKAALEKSTAALGEANTFTKGNVEAIVASGKILSSGLQDLGATMVAETRGAFETLTADAKELAAAKSPTEFFQVQSALVRKQFDGAVAQASKNTEAFLKLANETVAPLSSRVTLAVEKVSKAA